MILSFCLLQRQIPETIGKSKIKQTEFQDNITPGKQRLCHFHHEKMKTKNQKGREIPAKTQNKGDKNQAINRKENR